MHGKPPSEMQVRYLQALGDTGPVPQTMAEASERINTLVRQRGGRRYA
jgi:hypothetical protein